MKTNLQASQNTNKLALSKQAKNHAKSGLPVSSRNSQTKPLTPFLEVTEGAAVMLVDLQNRIEEMKPLQAVAFAGDLFLLLQFHPGLSEEKTALRNISASWTALQRSFNDNIVDGINLDETHRLYAKALQRLVDNALSQPTMHDVLCLAGELDCLADIAMHNPHLQNEVRLMRAFERGVSQFLHSKVITWSRAQ